MKLQSQATRRFEAAELQALARRARPSTLPAYLVFAFAGLATGCLVVLAFRLLAP